MQLFYRAFFFMALVVALLYMGEAFAASPDERCHWDAIPLVPPTNPAPKIRASVVKPPLVIATGAPKPPKPKVRKYKTFPVIHPDGWVYNCDDEPIQKEEPTTFAAVPPTTLAPLDLPPTSAGPSKKDEPADPSGTDSGPTYGYASAPPYYGGGFFGGGGAVYAPPCPCVDVPIIPVPEPETYMLILAGLAFIAARRRAC